MTDTREFVARVQDMKSSLVDPIITPRFAPSCTRELMTSLGQLAADKDVRIQTHLSECQAEIDWVAELEPWAQNYTDVYDQTGLLTDKTILAHGVYLTPDQLKVISGAGAAIAHCPNSNNAIRSGNMDVVRYRGMKIGLGTDASGGNIITSMNYIIQPFLHLRKTKAKEHFQKSFEVMLNKSLERT